MNEKVVKFIKIASVVASIFGIIGSSWADNKENELNLKKFVNEHFEKGE